MGIPFDNYLENLLEIIWENFLGELPGNRFFAIPWRCVGDLSLKLRLGIYLGSISGNLLENSFLDISKSIIRQFFGAALLGNSLGHLIANLENAMGIFSQATLW